MAKKDAYWFRHDSTAGRGLRMRKMAFIYGHWGKGIYWDVIEILRDQSNYSFNCDELSLKMLSDLIGCKDSDKFINWFSDCINFELFKKDDSVFYSEVLIENMGVWETKKHNGSQGGRGKKKANQKLIKSETIANRNHNIIEDNIIEDKSILKNQLSQWFNDLPNSIELEDISRNTNIPKENLIKRIGDFKKVCEISYPNYAKFVFHFKNWINKNPQTQPKKRNALL